MSNYTYSGIDAFGEDTGSFTYPGIDEKKFISVATLPEADASRTIKKLSGDFPIIWFIDDERANREWFRDFHVNDFSIITFSSRALFSKCLKKDIPCDGIVTDIFFPSNQITNRDDADALLSIYEKMKNAQVRSLHKLWEDERDFWSLDGFSIAHDAVYKKPPIPVFLFSRKATLLLNMEDFIDESPAVGNSYWLLEKIDPSSPIEKSKRAARLQRQNYVYSWH